MNLIRSIIRFVTTLSVAVASPTLTIAHEYWLDPIDSSVMRGDSVIVDVRNGQDFSGSAFPYDSNKYRSITISNVDKTVPYTGRLGDYPAIHPELTTNGLHTIHLESSASILVYESMTEFNAFLDYHALDKIRSQHAERKLPEHNIKERYFRSAKTIVQVSDTGSLTPAEIEEENINGSKAFKSTGARFELILLDNPYSSIDSLRVKLLNKRQPVPDRQVELFWKADQTTRVTAKTDKQGIASFKMTGNGDYLLNAVQVLKPESDDVHWQSHWASITFER